jgi:CRP-like cAMP-binding protein
VAVETSRIAALPAFAGLPEAVLDELASAMRELEVDAGAEIVTVDHYGDAVYLVEDGEAEVRTDSDEPPSTLGPATPSARSGSS